MKSIQVQLTMSLLLATSILTIAAATTFYIYIRWAFIEQLDHSLNSQSILLSSAVEVNKGKTSFDNLPAFGDSVGKGRHDRDYFEIWTVDGTPVFRSGSLLADNLRYNFPRDTTFTNITLPNGRNARACFRSFQPFSDDPQLKESTGTTKRSISARPSPLVLGIAHDRGEVDERLHVIAGSLCIVSLASLFMIASVVPFTIRKALRPLRQISLDADRIDINTLSHRFDTGGKLPSEILPICVRLNELMERLQQAFKREQRFTADAAHELRTPVAELRALTEVAIKWPPEEDGILQNYRETLAIALQMESIVTTLLQLARNEGGHETLFLQPIQIRETLTSAWAHYRCEADCKSLRMVWNLPEEIIVMSDATMLSQVLNNLFSNAVYYAMIDSEIICDVLLEETNTSIMIANKSEPLTDSDLVEMFQPYWRKDPARSVQQRSGLGLAIAASYAKAMGHRLEASFRDGTFAITITFHRLDRS